MSNPRWLHPRFYHRCGECKFFLGQGWDLGASFGFPGLLCTLVYASCHHILEPLWRHLLAHVWIRLYISPWCPLFRILTGKSGYLDDMLFLSGLSGYMGKKWSKHPKIRIFCILSFIVSGWCQDILEISIHPLPVLSHFHILLILLLLLFVGVYHLLPEMSGY